MQDKGLIFYVYEHWRPDKNICFYVGKGCGRRSRVMYGRKEHHQRIQKKLARMGLSVEIRIIATGLSDDDAKALEMERIAFWLAKGCDLANRTAGGDGGVNPHPETRAKMRAAKLGTKHSDEQKAKISASTKAALNAPGMSERLSAAIRAASQRPEVKEKRSRSQKARIRTKEHAQRISAAHMGKKLSPEHIEKMRKGLTGRKQSHEEIEKRRLANSGRKRSPEFCAKMKEMWSDDRKERQIRERSIPIICINDRKEFPSAKEAAKFYGVDNSMITKVCKGKFKDTKGFSFKYLEELR
jgi:hypothetical protein